MPDYRAYIVGIGGPFNSTRAEFLHNHPDDTTAKPGLSDEKAARMMIAFRAGSTLRRFHLKASKFEAYCTQHPELPQAGKASRPPG